MNQKELLKHYRDQIDTIDLEMVYLLSRRFEIVTQIWDIKKDIDLETYQSDRWEEVMHMLYEEADERWVNRELILDMWEKIHKESMRLQK